MSARTRGLRLALACAFALQAAACADPAARKIEHFEKGQAFATGGRYAEAILQFRNAIAADATFAEAHLALAQAYDRTDDSVNAYRSYQRAADLRPDDVAVQLATAKFLLKVRQFQDAKARAARALQLDAKNAEGYMVLASALAGLRDVNGAITQVQEAIDLTPDSSGGYTGMGSLLLTQGKVSEAQAQFEKAVAAGPHSAEPRVALAAYHWSVGDLKKAETIFREAIALDRDHPTANRAMALLLMSTNRAAEAEPYLKVVGRTLGTPEAELPLADYYVRGGRTAEAREILERAAVSGNASAIVRLARLDFAENHRDRANSRLDALLARQPSNSEALIAKGRWLLLEGKLDEALLRAETATQRDPGNAGGFLLLADVRSALGMSADAATAYRDVLRLNPRAAAAHTALSRINLAAGNAESSVEFARGALLEEPGNDEARVLLAKGLIQRGELQRAAEEIAILAARRADDPVVATLQGTLKMRQGDRAGSRVLFEQAVRRAPADIEALTGLTALDAADGQIGRARERLAAALAQNGSNVPLLLLAARADLQAGDFTSAEQRARAAIDRDPSQAQAYELLGTVYIRQQKLDAALAEFEQLLQKDPRSIGFLSVVGMIHEAKGQTHEAEKAYERALLVDSRATVAANNLAYLLAERGDNLEYALVLARDAAQMTPGDPAIIDTVGWVLLKKQQPEQAIIEFQKAVQLAADNAVFHYHLGLAYAQANNPARAKAALQQALQLNPNFPGADEARARLRSLTN